MNIGNPSPQEIFDSYSQIPNTAQGKQMLSQLAQAFKNSGDMRGSIATSILNSYNAQQAAPPPPQGQVVDRVVAQAEPPSWQQGIAAPGLAAPGMAGGGLVAFAEGGPVRGFFNGGETDNSWESPSWTLEGIYKQYMGETPDDLTQEEDYYATTEPSPSKRRELDARRAAMDPTAGVGSAVMSEDMMSKDRMSDIYGGALKGTAPNVPDDLRGILPLLSHSNTSAAGAEPPRGPQEEEEEETEELPVSRSLAPQAKAPKSFDSQLQGMIDLYGVPPDVAAELVSKREHNMAKRQKFNTFENIAAALGGYLSSYGTGAHRAGVGITSMLASMGQHEREDRADEEMLDALRMKSATMPYEFRKGLIDQLLAIETAQAKADRAYREKVALEGMKLTGRKDIESQRGEIQKEVARIRSSDEKGQLTPAVRANLKAKAQANAAASPGYAMKSPEERARIDQEYYDSMLRNAGFASPPTSTVPQVVYTPASP